MEINIRHLSYKLILILVLLESITVGFVFFLSGSEAYLNHHKPLAWSWLIGGLGGCILLLGLRRLIHLRNGLILIPLASFFMFILFWIEQLPIWTHQTIFEIACKGFLGVFFATSGVCFIYVALVKYSKGLAVKVRIKTVDYDVSSFSYIKLAILIGCYEMLALPMLEHWPLHLQNHFLNGLICGGVIASIVTFLMVAMFNYLANKDSKTGLSVILLLN